jgi:hypothetical protein
VSVDDLQPGTDLLVYDGEAIEVAQVDNHIGTEYMYDLTVAAAVCASGKA